MTEPELADAQPSVDDGTDRGRDRADKSGQTKPASSRSTLAARYRSLFVIGRGGMGSVEAALAIEPSPASSSTHAHAHAHAEGPPSSSMRGGRPYERVVALKRLLPDGARDKRRVDMFLREARLAAMLDHPNIVRAYDYGEIDGELFLAMEYVEGQPLSRVLRELADAGEKMPVGVAAYVMAEVCRGLHAAHELADKVTGLPLQLVHRDVSPQNVMLGYDGRVRLLDFGVAKIESENVTKTGEVKGKTAYMSPEQAMGDALDRRSDLFGVGAILYECIALRRMWGDGTDMDVIRRLALEKPPALETSNVELPKGLSELHARLVAREAQHRPATAIEASGAFLDFVDNTDSAAEAVRGIMDAHFAEQAREQRARLSVALNEVAPSQADQLRESVLPALAITPTRTPKAVAPAKDSTPPSAGRTALRSRLPALALLGVAIAGIVVWRSGVSSDAAQRPPAAAPTASAPVLAAPPPPATSAGTALSTSTTASPPTPSAMATATAPATANTGRGRPPVASSSSGAARVLAMPRIVGTPSAAPTSSARLVPTTTTPAKPSDVDDHPF